MSGWEGRNEDNSVEKYFLWRREINGIKAWGGCGCRWIRLILLFLFISWLFPLFKKWEMLLHVCKSLGAVQKDWKSWDRIGLTVPEKEVGWGFSL